LRDPTLGLPRPAVAEAERLLGDAGGAAAARLGLPPDAPVPVLRQAAFDALATWRRHGVNPMLGRAATQVCRVVVRSCEGIVADLAR
jgi:hypothetical protein